MSQQPGILSGRRRQALAQQWELFGEYGRGERRHAPCKWQNLPAVKLATRNCGGHRCPSRPSRLASNCSTAAAASP